MENANNYDYNDTTGPIIVISMWILAGVSFLFVALRIFCKLTRARLWWDDYFMIAAWIFLAASCATATETVQLGQGRHKVFIRPQDGASLTIYGNITFCADALGAVCSKASFALTLLRLIQGKLKVAVTFVLVSVVILLGLPALFVWVRCMPPAKVWNPDVEGTCWPVAIYPNFTIFASVYSVCMDFLLALLPWKILWNVQMNTRDKIGVGIAMSMGIFAGATSIAKTAALLTLEDADITYTTANLIIWTAAEVAATVMAASIPVLRVLFRDATSSRKRGNTSGQGKDYRFGTVRGQRVVISSGFDNMQERDGSRDIILDDMSVPGKIVQRFDVNVEYGDAEERFRRFEQQRRDTHYDADSSDESNHKEYTR